MHTYKWLASLALAAIVTTQTGCVTMVVGGASAMVASVANDRRTMGTQLDDTTTQGRVATRISKLENLEGNANVQVDVYNGVVLLTGQVNNQSLLTEIVTQAQSVPNIAKIHNQLKLAEPISAGQKANDVWLASKVRTQLFADERIPGLQVVVTVQNGEVFLMGRVSNTEATNAIEVTRNINGVKRVIRVFEIM